MRVYTAFVWAILLFFTSGCAGNYLSENGKIISKSGVTIECPRGINTQCESFFFIMPECFVVCLMSEGSSFFKLKDIKTLELTS